MLIDQINFEIDWAQQDRTVKQEIPHHWLIHDQMKYNRKNNNIPELELDHWNGNQFRHKSCLMMSVQVFLLDDILQVSELVHSAGVGAEPLLEEAAGGTPLVELEEIHGTPLVWSPTDELVNDLSDELVVVSA